MDENKLRKRKQKAIASGNRDNIAAACRSLGDHLNQVGRYKDAIEEYKEEAKYYERLRKELDMAKANRMVSEMYMLLSEFDSALRYGNLYLKTVQRLRNTVEEQRAFATIGRAYLLKGQSLIGSNLAVKSLKSAEKAFMQGLVVCKELSGKVSKTELIDMQTRLYLNIGVVREHLEDFDQSITYIQKAIKISKENDLYELLHLCYVSASLLYFYKLNDTSSALRYINLALEVVKCLPNRVKKECESLLTKSEYFIKNGDFYGAKQVLHKAYKLKSPDENDQGTIKSQLKVVAALCYALDSLVTISSTDYAMQKKLYEKMGDGCCLLENYKKAADYYLKMLECAEKKGESGKDLTPIYVSLYQTYKDNEEYELALKYLWMELEINKGEPVEAFNTLCNIAEIYELQSKPFWTIHDLYQKAMDEAKKAKNLRLEKIAMVRLMKLEQKSNMHTLAENLKEQAETMGIDLTYDSDEETGVVSEHNTPDIGDDICLEDLTDSDNEAVTNGAQRPKRKRGTCLTIKRNNKGETQLHQACIAGNLQLVRRLVEQGHVVNVRDHAGWLPLHEACNHGFKDIVEYLLDHGALSAVNDKGGVNCDGITPLYDACSNGYLEVVKILLDNGAKATITTDFGDNPLNILQKWRSTADLLPSDEALYESIKKRLTHQLTQSGNVSETVTISDNSHNALNKSSSSDSSPNKHKKFCFEDDNEDENVYSQQVSQDSPKSYHSDENNLRNYASTFPTTSKYQRVKDEYKETMESMKHPNRRSGSVSFSVVTSSKKKPAYMAEEDVGDDWLEDDMGPTKKKRKHFSDENKSPRKKSSARNTPIKASPANELLHIEEDSSDSVEAILRSINSIEVKTKQPDRSRRLSVGRTKQKRQASLLQIGFSRSKGNLETDNDDSTDSHTEPDSTTTIPTKSQSSSQSSSHNIVPTIASTVSFKIKVEDELLLVPIDRKKLGDINIRWLAEEASRRYYNLVGIKPSLRLMTADGFAFESSDNVSVALNESMITSKVLDWHVTPLPQRYEEICYQMSKDCDPEIKKFLDRSQALNTLSFGDICLMPDTCQPVFKAILHQSVLCALDLTDSFIQDEGCKHLAAALPSLKHLKSLNLEGNCITNEGIKHLNNGLKNVSLEIEELSLSSNPLQDKSIQSLDTLCNSLTKLTKLDISSCSISNFYNFNLRFDELISFNVSFNSLTGKTFKYLLTQLNSSKLEYLNLNYCVDDIDLGRKIIEFLEAGTCEKFKTIKLSLKFLTDVDIYYMTQNLCKSSDLEEIEISSNQNITMQSLIYILEKLVCVKKIYLQGCCKVLNSSISPDVRDIQRVQYPKLMALTLPEAHSAEVNSIERISQFWESCHRDGKIHKTARLIYFYVDGNDLL